MQDLRADENSSFKHSDDQVDLSRKSLLHQFNLHNTSSSSPAINIYNSKDRRVTLKYKNATTNTVIKKHSVTGMNETGDMIGISPTLSTPVIIPYKLF